MKTDEETKKDLSMNRGVSRRTFIKGAAAGAGIIAATGSGLTGKEASEARAAQSLTARERITAERIKQAGSADVIVLGAGMAGLAAALSATEAGAKVIVIEQEKTYQIRGIDIGVIGSRLQKELGIVIDRNEVCLAYQYYFHNRTDQRLLRIWANESGAAFDWLAKMGDAEGLTWTIARWPNPPSYDNSKEWYKCYNSAHETTDLNKAFGIVKTNAEKKGAQFIFETTAKELVREEGGRVKAVIARNMAGDYVQYNATRGIILATGDYSANKEMMEKYCPQAAYLKGVVKTSTGEGLLMAMDIGAVMEMGPHAPISHGMPQPLGNGGWLNVNIFGERFQNEEIEGQNWTNQVERQPGRTAWQVFDSKWERQVPLGMIGHGSYTEVTDELRRSVDGSVKADITEESMPSSLKDLGISLPGSGKTLKAETIEELAKKMQVPVETFKATIKRYNELCYAGYDEDFGKSFRRLFPVDTPPFYAGKGMYVLLVVFSGLVCNPKMQALDKDFKVIPGLYLAGNTIGGRMSGDYPLICAGISHGMALTYGRLAGKTAAAEKV